MIHTKLHWENVQTTNQNCLPSAWWKFQQDVLQDYLTTNRCSDQSLSARTPLQSSQKLSGWLLKGFLVWTLNNTGDKGNVERLNSYCENGVMSHPENEEKWPHAALATHSFSFLSPLVSGYILRRFDEEVWWQLQCVLARDSAGSSTWCLWPLSETPRINRLNVFFFMQVVFFLECWFSHIEFKYQPCWAFCVSYPWRAFGKRRRCHSGNRTAGRNIWPLETSVISGWKEEDMLNHNTSIAQSDARFSKGTSILRNHGWWDVAKCASTLFSWKMQSASKQACTSGVQSGSARVNKLPCWSERFAHISEIISTYIVQQITQLYQFSLEAVTWLFNEHAIQSASRDSNSTRNTSNHHTNVLLWRDNCVDRGGVFNDNDNTYMCWLGWGGGLPQ